VINRRWYAAVLLLVACGGGGGAEVAAVQPANTPSAAVREFMRAVADSNLDKMAMLWGTAKGPAARTRQPADYERRIVIMQSYLSHDDSRILSDTPEASEGQHTLQVELRRQACTWTVPFGAVQLGDRSWIVQRIDLTAAGNPARPCNPSGPNASPDSTR